MNTYVHRRRPKWPKPPKIQPARPPHGTAYEELVQEALASEQMNPVERNLLGWPWQYDDTRLLTIAPHFHNIYYTGGGPPADQNTGNLGNLAHFMKENMDVARIILDMVFSNHRTASALSMTCQQMFGIVSNHAHLWDLTEGYFMNCELPGNQGSVGSVVNVTPVRNPNTRPSYGRQLNNMHKLVRSMYNYSDNFKILHLYRVPFMTPEVLELVIPHLTKLKVLGIYKCPLIHVGHTKQLLEIVRTDRFMKGYPPVSLDFFPQFHIGPVQLPGVRNWSGSYGVTWDNVEIDTRLAVWKIVREVLPIARSQGCDFESTSSAFRQWLDKGPCWQVEETLKLLGMDMPTNAEDVISREEQIVAQVDYPLYHGSVTRMKKGLPNRPEGCQYKLRSYRCFQCDQPVLGVFYDHFQIEELIREQALPAGPNDRTTMVCLGCKLHGLLDCEDDHYKQYKRVIISKWLELDEFESREEVPLLSRALSTKPFKALLRRGANLEKIRRESAEQTEPNTYDREYEETQRYMEPSRTKIDRTHKSPTIADKHAATDEWNSYREDRLIAHGFW